MKLFPDLKAGDLWSCCASTAAELQKLHSFRGIESRQQYRQLTLSAEATYT